jgi:hypothetical protein
MLSADKTHLLQNFLSGLPSDSATRLVRAIEIDRLMENKGLPHEMILEGLRPALRRDGAERTPTPLRLFCRPFEDILNSEPRAAKQKAVVARSSVTPVWMWLSRSLAPKETASYATDVKALVMAAKLDDALERAAEFWSFAGTGIRQALAQDVSRKEARLALGGELVLADAEDMALLLSAAPQVLKVQTILPRPVPHLNEDLLWQLREVYDELVASQPDVAPYIAVVAMRRLARPWEALKLPLQIARRTQDTLIAKTDMGLVGEILLAQMDALQSAILKARHPLPGVEMLLEQVSSFAELSSAIVKEIEIRRDGEWGKRLLKERAAVGNVMDGLMDRAPKELAAALPLQKSNGPKQADFGRPADAEKQAVALRYVKLVTGCRNFAAAASCAAKQKANAEAMANYLKRHNEDLVKELRGSDAKRRAVAESQLDLCIELTSLLFSAEEGELLRRRARAAQSAAA